jgi:hypothetical protein
MDDRVHELGINQDGPKFEVYVEVWLEGNNIRQYHSFEGTTRRQALDAFYSWASENLT